MPPLRLHQVDVEQAAADVVAVAADEAPVASVAARRRRLVSARTRG